MLIYEVTLAWNKDNEIYSEIKELLGIGYFTNSSWGFSDSKEINEKLTKYWNNNSKTILLEYKPETIGKECLVKLYLISSKENVIKQLSEKLEELKEKEIRINKTIYDTSRDHTSMLSVFALALYSETF